MIIYNRLIGLMGRVFANSQGDQGSISNTGCFHSYIVSILQLDANCLQGDIV